MPVGSGFKHLLFSEGVRVEQRGRLQKKRKDEGAGIGGKAILTRLQYSWSDLGDDSTRDNRYAKGWG